MSTFNRRHTPIRVVANPEELCLRPPSFVMNADYIGRNPIHQSALQIGNQLAPNTKVPFQTTPEVQRGNNLQKRPILKLHKTPDSNGFLADVNDVENSAVQFSALTVGNHHVPKSNVPMQTVTDIQNVVKAQKRPIVKFYKTLHRNAVLAHLTHPCEFQIAGFLKVSVLHGEISIFGYNQTMNSKPILIYASPHLKSYKIRTRVGDIESLERLKAKLISEKLLETKEISHILSNIKSSDSIILIEEIPASNFVNAKQYTASILSEPTPMEPGLLPRDCRTVKCSVLPTTTDDDYDSILQPSEWDSITLGERTVVVGGSNVGKSTVAKYFVNKLLCSHEMVLFLDFDQGQSEFTPPGTLGAVLMKRPLFGPNFTHGLRSERMIHLGVVDAALCAERYLEAVKDLVEFANNMYGSIPWIINTMGFARGIGLHIISRVILTVKPTDLVEILSKNKKKNFIYKLTPEKIQTEEPLPYDWRRPQTIFYNHFEVNSCTDDFPQSKSGVSKKNSRNRMMLAYLCEMLNSPNFSFNAVQPYCISFSSVSIGLLEPLPPGELLRVLNCGLVSLCKLKNTPLKEKALQPAEENATNLSIILRPPILPCVGLGIIRGIDNVAKKLYLITPVSEEELHTVDLLCLSFVSLPDEIFLHQEGVDGNVPYLTQNSDQLALKEINRLFRQQKPQQCLD